MRRFLAVLSLCISLVILGFWRITSPEILPSKDTKWHTYKRKLFMKFLSFKRDKYSNNHVPLCSEKIDLVFLCAEKDLPAIRSAIDAAKGLVMHPINKIYLICPESEKLRKVAQEKDCEFIEESKVVPHLAKGNILPEHLKQQFIKLNADIVTTTDYFLIIDADTILLQTQIFLREGKAIFNATNGYVLERKRMVESVLKLGKYYNLDFTSHHMFFEKAKLKAMKKRLEELHGKPWQDALNNPEIPVPYFSEYEMYANFVLTFFPDEATIVNGRNSWMPADRISGIEWQRGFLSSRYKSVSFHHFMTTDHYS
ncbi:MAG: DUF6492 family protein [Pseudomonadota bacterium]|jgi:hypothetical protein|nr:DUF6492 family protein [Alphaproteobacteria bacterium]